MKQYVFSLIIACLGTMAAFAQYVPTPQVTALTHEASGSLATIPLEFTPQSSNIDATTLPASATLSNPATAEVPRSRQIRNAPRRRFRPHFAALGEIGLGSDIDINATWGAQLLPFYYMGGGLNITYWHDGFIRDHDRFDLNLIINPRFEIPTRSIVTPFIDIKSGFALTHKHGPYFAFSTGVQLKNLILGVGYTMQVTNEEYTGLFSSTALRTNSQRGNIVQLLQKATLELHSKKTPTFWKKSPTFLEKSPTFFEKRRRFFCVCPRFVPLLTDSA